MDSLLDHTAAGDTARQQPHTEDCSNRKAMVRGVASDGIILL